MISTGLTAVFLATGCVLFAVTVQARWRVRSPAAHLFAVVAATAGAGAFAFAAGFAFDEPTVVLGTTIALGLVLPIPWAIFTFAYTGYEDLVSLRVAGAVATPAVLGLVATIVVFGSTVLDVPSLSTGDGDGLIAATLTFLNMGQWFALLYAGGLLLVCSGLLTWTFHRYDHLDSTTGTALATFGTAPWASILFGLQVESVSTLALGTTVAIGTLVGTGAAVGLVGPTSLFERVPSAGTIGPKTVIDELPDLVVVTDREGRIVELNGTAHRELDVASGSVLGADVRELLRVSVADLQGASTIELESAGGRVLYEPTVSAVTDQHDHLLGYAIVLRDVTARTTRQQRLEVFNRVLRHNLRNEMNTITGHAELIGSRVDDDAVLESRDAILRAGETLTGLSETVRDAERLLDADAPSDRGTRLAPTVEGVLSTAETEHDAVTCRSDVPDGIVVELPTDLLRLALEHLVENAIEHNDRDRPEVRISASYDDGERYPLRISVADDGPGIPTQDLESVERGSETALNHGSGIGLWVVRWVTTNLGGKLEFDERDDRGSVVSITLPSAHVDSDASTAPEGHRVDT